jgi:hypothetical protein
MLERQSNQPVNKSEKFVYVVTYRVAGLYRKGIDQSIPGIIECAHWSVYNPFCSLGNCSEGDCYELAEDGELREFKNSDDEAVDLFYSGDIVDGRPIDGAELDFKLWVDVEFLSSELNGLLPENVLSEVLTRCNQVDIEIYFRSDDFEIVRHQIKKVEAYRQDGEDN